MRKTIDNNIRYQGDPEMKAMYHRELGEYLKSAIAGAFSSMRRLQVDNISEEQIKERREKERSEREIDRSMAKDMVSG